MEASIIGLVGSVIVAIVTYWLTKAREREAEWRKEKLAYYKKFIESLGEIVEGDATEEGHRNFAKSTNNLLLFAPQTVINSVNAFRTEISTFNKERSKSAHDKLLAEMLLAIRKDVGVEPDDDAGNFVAILWASGAGVKAPNTTSGG